MTGEQAVMRATGHGHRVRVNRYINPRLDKCLTAGWPMGTGPGSDKCQVDFRLNGDHIAVFSKLYPTIMITKQWDVFQEDCLVYTKSDEEECTRQCTIEQISRLALEPLFFKNLGITYFPDLAPHWSPVHG